MSISVAMELKKLIVFLSEKGGCISDENLKKYEEKFRLVNSSSEEDLHLIEFYKDNLKQDDFIQSMIDRLKKIQITLGK